MRELHVVAVSDDGRHVVLAGKRGATTGGFRVALDDRLAAAVRGDLPRPGEDSTAAPELSPKEIQARLRSGESAESIAASAGVPVPRVERFAGPVQGEMARMIDAARSAYLVRGRLGRSAVPLGAAVEAALAQGPAPADGLDWSTYRLDDGGWQVTVSWFARKRNRTASWRYDPVAKALTPADPQSAALGYLDPDAPQPARRGAAPATRATATPARRPARKATAKKATARKATAKKATAKAPAAKKAAPAKKATAKKATARKAAPARATTKTTTKASTKTTAKKAGPAKSAPTRAARKAAPAAGAADRRTGATAARRALRVVPDPEPQPRRTSAERDGVKSRASVPAWADVLLGTSPGGEQR